MVGPSCDGCTHYDSVTQGFPILSGPTGCFVLCCIYMYDILLACFTQSLLASPLVFVTLYMKLSSRLPSISLPLLKLSIFAANFRHLHLHNTWTPETACLKVNYSTHMSFLEWIDKITEIHPVSATKSIGKDFHTLLGYTGWHLHKVTVPVKIP